MCSIAIVVVVAAVVVYSVFVTRANVALIFGGVVRATVVTAVQKAATKCWFLIEVFAKVRLRVLVSG